MFDAIASILAWFYDLVPNYAVAIGLLTLSIMVVLTPLTLKGTRSMMAMQQLQPEMKKLQAKYKDDRQKLNEEMLKFYRENKINPVGGCLPLLIQAPVFIVLYQVLIRLTSSQSYGTAVGGAVGANLSGGSDGVYQAAGTFEPSYLDPSTTLYQDLAGAREMLSFGTDLAISAQTALSASFVSALPYLVLILAVTGTSYVQQKQISGRNPNAQTSSQQQLLLKLMPAFFAVISLTLPAGVVVYFLVSNLYRMGQQGYISRTMYSEGAASSGPGDGKAGGDGSGTIEASSRPAKGAEAPSTASAGRPKGLLGALGLGGSTDAAPPDPSSGLEGNGAGGGPARNKSTGNGSASKAKSPARASSRTGGGAGQNRSKKKKKRK